MESTLWCWRILPARTSPVRTRESANYNLSTGDLDSEDVITAWHIEQELRTGKYSVTDYNFETPKSSLMANEPTVVEVGGNTKFETYDYPGIHLTSSDGGAVAKIRMQEEEASHVVITGSSVCRAFTTGCKFDLKEHYRDDMNTSYVLTEIQHVATVGSYSQEETVDPAKYSNHFRRILDDSVRPPRITPKPFVQGPQTALVVGKSGEEIWVYKRTAASRCSLTGTAWKSGRKQLVLDSRFAALGRKDGAMWIPRMGQEVVVEVCRKAIRTAR